MNFFQNMLKSIKDQIKWGNRNPQEQKKVEPIKIEEHHAPTTNQMKRVRRSPQQLRKRILRKISRASRRANIRRGLQWARI